MSQGINIENYERYALDYIEGTLNAEDNAAFEAFLLLHPEVAEELELLGDDTILRPREGVSFDRNSLKIEVRATAHIDGSNYEEKFISEVEGTLPPSEAEELDRFVDQNPALTRDRQLYLHTRLQPDEHVVFPNHGALKRSIPLWDQGRQWALRAAAVAVIALGSMTVWNALDEARYEPRYRSLDYSSMDPVDHAGRRVTIQEEGDASSGLVAVEDHQAETTIATTATQTISVPASLPRKRATIQQGAQGIPSRELMAYQPSISAWPESESASIDQPMNLAQFIGKQWFGVDPKQASTTKEVIRESLIQTIDQRESISLQASSPDAQKRSFEFLAGNFEFKRVSYK